MWDGSVLARRLGFEWLLSGGRRARFRELGELGFKDGRKSRRSRGRAFLSCRKSPGNEQIGNGRTGTAHDVDMTTTCGNSRGRRESDHAAARGFAPDGCECADA